MLTITNGWSRERKRGGKRGGEKASRGSVISLGSRGDGRNSTEFQVGWRLSGLGGYTSIRISSNIHCSCSKIENNVN